MVRERMLRRFSAGNDRHLLVAGTQIDPPFNQIDRLAVHISLVEDRLALAHFLNIGLARQFFKILGVEHVRGHQRPQCCFIYEISH